MTILSTASDAIQGTFSIVSDAANATQTSLQVVTGYVEKRAISFNLSDADYVQKETAKKLEAIEEELKASKPLRAMFDKLDGMFEPNFKRK